jgi:arylformamidase
MSDEGRFGRRAGPLRRLLAQRWRERLGVAAGAAADAGAGEDGALGNMLRRRFGHEPPPGVERLDDLAYGEHARQRVDVYRRSLATDARARSADGPVPVLVVVHGGAWARGDKRHVPSIAARVEHWCRDAGWVVVAVNYRLIPPRSLRSLPPEGAGPPWGGPAAGLVPDATPREQAGDVACALAFVQAHARAWGGDAGRVVLMGHSAGAHLAALASVDPRLRDQAGATAWAATVALDGAALDVPALMAQPHLPLFDRAFGADLPRWREASPTLVMHAAPPMPMLMVHAAGRPDSSAQARAFARRATEFGGRVAVLPVDLDHAQINALAGAPGPLTDAIDGFLAQALAA